MKMPRWMLRHTISVEAYAGEGAYGPTYDAATDVQCWAETRIRTVRSNSGDDVVSTATFFCPIDASVPQESRITYEGRVYRVLDVLRRDGGGLPVPEHLEVVCG